MLQSNILDNPFSYDLLMTMKIVNVILTYFSKKYKKRKNNKERNQITFTVMQCTEIAMLSCITNYMVIQYEQNMKFACLKFFFLSVEEFNNATDGILIIFSK